MQLMWKRYKNRAVQIVELIVYTEKPESLADPDPMCAKQSGKRLSWVLGENNYSEILLRRWQPPIPRRKDPNLHMSSHPAVYGLQYVVNHTDIGNILHLYMFLKIGTFFLKAIYHLTFSKKVCS